ncbi:YjcZ family sporulation protein [Alkalicoccobacillus gibsonii]
MGSHNGGFSLIVVLFILLVIIGASSFGGKGKGHGGDYDNNEKY